MLSYSFCKSFYVIDEYNNQFKIRKNGVEYILDFK